MTDQEYFAASTCGHCLNAIRRLSVGAPDGYVPIRVRQLKEGQYFRYGIVSQNDLVVTNIETKINCSETNKRGFTIVGERQKIEKCNDRHQFGKNDQSWCWLWTGKK